MTRTGQDAINYARSRVGTYMPDSGLCLQFVRTCFDVGSYYYSAIDAWNASPTKHPGDRNPPPAVPLYFSTPSQYDHVVFCCSPNEIVTTFNDQIRSYTGNAISGIERDFNGTYLGWTEDINRVTVWAPTPPEDDMPTTEEITNAVGDRVKEILRAPEFQGYMRDLPWESIVGDDKGTDYTSNFLVVSRYAPEANSKLDTLVETESKGGTRNISLFVLALVVLIAVVGGVAVGLLADTSDGVVAGASAIIGGLLTVVLRGLGARRNE
jgi:hypothetical protein